MTTNTQQSKKVLALSLAGRLANGEERDHGRLDHLVILGRSVALCGAKPGRRSGGWVPFDRAEALDRVATCDRCGAIFAHHSHGNDRLEYATAADLAAFEGRPALTRDAAASRNPIGALWDRLTSIRELADADHNGPIAAIAGEALALIAELEATGNTARAALAKIEAGERWVKEGPYGGPIDRHFSIYAETETSYGPTVADVYTSHITPESLKTAEARADVMILGLALCRWVAGLDRIGGTNE